MRKKRHGSERISACSDILIKKETPFTEILQYYKDSSLPFCLEIGCGKGAFAVGITEKRKGMNLLAIERVADVCCLALEKAKKAEADGVIEGGRLAFYIGNADELLASVPDGSVDTVYLNISPRKTSIEKNEMMLLDLLASFDWKRPISFTQVYMLQDFGLLNALTSWPNILHM